MPIDDKDQYPVNSGPDDTSSDVGADMAQNTPRQPLPPQAQPPQTGPEPVLPASEFAVPNEAMRYVNETAPTVAPAPTFAQDSVAPPSLQQDAQWEIEQGTGLRPEPAVAPQAPLATPTRPAETVPPAQQPLTQPPETPPVTNKLPSVNDYQFPSIFESNVTQPPADEPAYAVQTPAHTPTPVQAPTADYAQEPAPADPYFSGREQLNVDSFTSAPQTLAPEPQPYAEPQPANPQYADQQNYANSAEQGAYNPNADDAAAQEPMAAAAAPSFVESFETAFVRGNEAAQSQADASQQAEASALAASGLAVGDSPAAAAAPPIVKKPSSSRPKKPPRKPRAPFIKNTLMRRSAWVASSVVGLIVLLVFILPLLLPNKTIAQEISRQVQSATGWTLKLAGPISVGIFPTPKFRADNVAISADGENNVLSVESLRFGINLGAIFTGDVRLNEVVLIGPNIDLILDENGQPTWQTSESAGGAIAGNSETGLRGSAGDQLVVDDTKSALQALELLQVDEVVLRNGTIRYRDLSNGSDHSITDIDLDTALQSLDVPLQLTGGFDYQGQHFDVSSQLDEPRAAIVGARTAIDTSIEGKFLKTSFGGAVDFGVGPAFGGQIAVVIPSVAQFASWLGAQIPDAAEGLESINATAELAASPTLVDVSNFALKIGEESVLGKVVADLTQEQPFISGELVSQGVDVATLLSASGLARPGLPSVSGSMIVDLQFATVGSAVEQMISSLNARGTLGLRSGTISGTGLGAVLGEPDADRIDAVTANITINTLDTPIGLIGQADWRGEQFDMQGRLGAGQMLANGMAPAQFTINSSRVSGGINGTVTQSGDFDGEISVETPSLRNLLGWLNQPIGEGSGLGAFRYAGELSLSPSALHFSQAQIALDGTRGSGSGTLEFAGKPSLNATLNLQQLDITPYLAQNASGSGSSAQNNNLPGVDGNASADWSNAAIDFSGLTAVNANLKIQAEEIIWDKLRTGTVAIDASLTDGILTADLTKMALYQGRGAGRLQVNAAEKVPTVSVNFDLASLSALPFLTDAADFSRIEGLTDISIALTARGRSELAMVSGLDGEARMTFNNGAFRGINIPRMVRTLSARTVLGWQSNESEKTDFSEFSGSFDISNGLARTRDIRLVGPLVRATGAGSIDLPAKTMEMRFDPKIVASLQGQGNNSDLAGLGVPIVVEGSISQPRIYPDIAGILENPEAAFEQLQKFGGGLAALTDDGGAVRDQLRDQVRDRTGIDLNQIVKDGRIDKDTAVGQGADLISKLLGGSQQPGAAVAPRGVDGQQPLQTASNIPVPRVDPRGSLVRQTAPSTAAPRFMTPEEARRISGGGNVVVSQPSNAAPAVPSSQPATNPTTNQGGGPIDLLNPGGGNRVNREAQPVGVGSGNPSGPPANPITGILRGIFNR